jgi:hypothetical protein
MYCINKNLPNSLIVPKSKDLETIPMALDAHQCPELGNELGTELRVSLEEWFNIRM